MPPVGGSAPSQPQTQVSQPAGTQQPQQQQVAMAAIPPPAPVAAPAPIAAPPAPVSAAPAPVAAAPAPIAAQPPVMAPAGMPMPPAPSPAATFPHPNAHIAAPMAPVPSAAPIAVHQHQSAATQKRRRMDVPVVGMPAPGPVLSDPIAVAAALQGRGRKKTQAQIDRRRERNRILARRTRLRKKFFFESLQKEVMDLQRENSALKDIVRGKVDGDESKQLLEGCDAAEKLPAAVLEACGEQAAEMDQQDFNLVRSIQQSQHCFIITDPSLQDNPIIFASNDFLSLTGYTKEEVLGRNCRFLQGEETSREKVEEIRKGLANGGDVSVTLANYTSDGTPFWNKLFIAALRDSQNNIVNFIGVVAKVPGPEAGDAEYGKVLPGQVVGEEGNEGDDAAGEAAIVSDATDEAIENAVDAALAAGASVVAG